MTITFCGVQPPVPAEYAGDAFLGAGQGGHR